MNIPFLASAIKRVNRSRLKRIMRGYRFIKKSGQLGLIDALYDELTNTPFAKIDYTASRLFFGAGVRKAELVTRQYLLTRIGGLGLNKALLYSLGVNGSSVIYPMPRVWQEIVAKHGFRVARLCCSLAWIGYIGLSLGYGALLIAKEFYVSLREIIRPRSPALARYAYFVGLNAGNLPQPCRDGRSHDIVTWYARWEGMPGNLNVLCHGVGNAKSCSIDGLPVVFNPHPLPPLDTPDGLLRFSGLVFGGILLAVFDLLRGRWWYALLLAEFARAAMARLQMSDKLARDYLFHNSDWIYRPLWTYEAEKKGSRITFYFYSTNCESFKRLDGYPMQTGSWQVMNWPLYLVWDEYQAGFVRRSVGEGANIKIAGPIWFQSSSVEMPELPAGCVAVFDVQPHRNSRYQIKGILQDYYIPRITNQFLLDIHAITRECKISMVYKRKRNIGQMIHPEYENLVKGLARADNVFSVEPDISAIRVIEGCFAVISMPFTSTALLGRALGKPSVYYDPAGVVLKDDRAAHGIQVLSGREELRGWLAGLL